MDYLSSDYYTSFNREEWKEFQTSNLAVPSNERLAQLVSMEDRLSEADVREIYGPLLHYIEADFHYSQKYNQARQSFFAGEAVKYRKVPFIIGISGSVAVGKSTTARLLNQLLAEAFPDRKVEMITTDGFLYPNQILEERNMMRRKGFPESYNMPLLLSFMSHIKTKDSPFSVPVYSHEHYDIVPGDYRVVDQPDILIVEGINVFQLPTNQQIYVSDFFDFSIYIDAEESLIHHWFVSRFLAHLDLAKDDPNSFYHEMSKMSREEAISYADDVWYTINLPNLIQNIKPTRSRADVILRKTTDHYMNQVLVKKY